MLSEGDKRRAQEIQSSPDALHYTSSEESCEDDAVEPRNIKAKLDKAYLAGLSEKQRRRSARVNLTAEESPRPHPTNGPRWAVRSD